MNGSPPSDRLVPLAVIGMAALVAACTSAPAADPSETEAPTTSAPPPSHEATTDPGPTSDEQVADLWQAFHAERLSQLQTDDEPDPAPFADLATEDATEAALALISVGRGEVARVFTDTEFWAEVEVTAGGDEATVSDCILIAQRPASRPDAEPTVISEEWTGAATATQDGWRISDVAPGAPDCVPRALNEQLIGQYTTWLDAHNQWWGAPESDPDTWAEPDPDHELLDEVMVGEGLADIRTQLVDGRDGGYVLREPHDPENAVVWELGLGTARVVDCHPVHPDRGVYDLDTGQRLDDRIPPPDPGQVNAHAVTLERTAPGQWKVDGWRVTRDSDCTPGETNHVVVP